MTVSIHQGDCRSVVPALGLDAHAVITDPPYELNFMGRAWDRSGVAFDPETWRVCLGALKPGGWLLAFGGTRTWHRIAVAIEDAGFEIRDTICWLYGSGFPKSHQSLKPGFEPIIVARKSPGGSIAANVAEHNCGELDIDGCRVEASQRDIEAARVPQPQFSTTGQIYGMKTGEGRNGETFDLSSGRWPANVIHDGSDEVAEAFAAFGEKASGKAGKNGHVRNQPPGNGIYGSGNGLWKESGPAGSLFGDSGSAARFFYAAKASRSERGEGNTHPTVKPIALMEYLVKLVNPGRGLVLDPFAGSGTTGIACLNLGAPFVGVEQDTGHCEVARRRLDDAANRVDGRLFV